MDNNYKTSQYYIDEKGGANDDESQILRKQLIREINEQIPYLAYGLTEKINRCNLQGKVTVRGVMGDDWGIGVSKNNPRKDIPNVVIYPESILAEEKAVTNARLRHEIGNLNHSLGVHLAKLREWCQANDLAYQLILPLVESIQEASVNYLEMQNSFAEDPAAAFRPLYQKAIDVQEIAENLGEAEPYKQAVDMALLKALSIVGLISEEVLQTAEKNANPKVSALFTKKINSIIAQAVKTPSARIKIQLVRDYLWREFSQLIPTELLSSSAMADAENLPLEAEQDASEQAEKNALIEKLQNAIDKLRQLKATEDAESEERQNAINQLLEEIKDALQEAGCAEDFEDLQKLLDPKESADDEDLADLAYQISEVGIDRDALSEGELDLLERLHKFAEATTVKYVRTMRFLMKNYQHRNDNFTDKIMAKMIAHHHDTPVFTIYGKTAGEEFINGIAADLNFEDDFIIHGFMLNINLPKLLGRFGYRKGDEGRKLPEGAIDWEFFTYSALPIIWTAVSCALDDNLFLCRINQQDEHDPPKYFYLYEATDYPYGDNLPMPPQDAVEAVSGSDEDDEDNKDNEDGDDSENNEAEASAGGNLTNQDERDSMDNLEANSDKSDSSSDNQSPSFSEGGSAHMSGGSTEMEQSEAQSNGQVTDRNSSGGYDEVEDLNELWDEFEDFKERLNKDYTEDMLSQLLELLQQVQTSDQQQAETTDEKVADGSGDSEGRSLAEDEDGEPEWGVKKPEQNDNAPYSEKGGLTNHRRLLELFSQLEESREKIKSRFETADGRMLDLQQLDFDDTEAEEPQTGMSVENLKTIKEEQSRQMESYYMEQSGLFGEALERYVDYREETNNLVNDLVDFFIEKFRLDVDFDYIQNQSRGSRLQNGWHHKLIGIKDDDLMLDPAIFERRSVPGRTQFIWSIIIDNSASCKGDIIEEEKKAALALIEVAKRLSIPLEILVFGDSKNYRFLKTFDQELYGEQLSAIVELNADQGTPDVATLEAACGSVTAFAEQFNRPYSFVYFMTDGKSGSGSIKSVIRRYQRDIVITGIGLAAASGSIAGTWGANSIGVEDIQNLSDLLIRKIEIQIEDIFD